MYGDLLQDLRDGLAVSSSWDARLSRGVTSAARSLLRVYNFREAVVKVTLPIAASTQFVSVPADFGKPVAVLLTVVEGGTKLFKRLRRREEGVFPYIDGPSFYSLQGGKLFLDQAMPLDAVGYNVELWYTTNSPVVAEPWLSVVYADVLEHKAGRELALKARKMEAYQAYDALWQEDMAVLGRYIPELEYSDLDISMGETYRSVASERYPA